MISVVHSFSRRWYQGFEKRLRAWWQGKVYALPVDIFRVLVGLLYVAYYIRLLVEVRDFSSPDGFLDHELLYRILWFTRLSLFQPGLGSWFFYCVFTLAGIGAWGIVLGYRVKLCAATLFLITVSSYRWNFLVLSIDDSIMHLLLFWLLLLPVGKTLIYSQWRQQGHHCLASWRQATVPGATLYCLLGNVCLIYWTAGLCKLQSAFWQQGFALYAILRQPIAYAPDLWGPQHLLLLQIGSYGVLGIEILLPLLLTRRVGHPCKWLGLLLQLGFHLGIVATLRVPFANLALMTTAVLFFREEIRHGVLQHRRKEQELPQMSRGTRSGQIALIFLSVLTLAMLRGMPGIGVIHKPAFALLWMAGMAQDYQLFKWIDTINYHIKHQVTVQHPGHPPQVLPATTVLPSSMRSVLMQAYLYNVPWMRIPSQHSRELRHSLLTRLAQRFCHLQNTTGLVTVQSTVSRIHPRNTALTRSRERLLVEFRCIQREATLCRTILTPHGRRPSACQ